METGQLVALYCRVTGDDARAFVKCETYIVRQWDGMDGCWTDCTAEVGLDDALRHWAEKTDGGARGVSYAEKSAYYRIFPGGTRMLWDENPREGRCTDERRPLVGDLPDPTRHGRRLRSPRATRLQGVGAS